MVEKEHLTTLCPYLLLPTKSILIKMPLKNKIKARLTNISFIILYVKRRFIKLFYNISGKDLPPRGIQIAVNNICNARCKMCDIGQGNIKSPVYKSMKSHKKEFDIKLFEKLIDDVKGFKPKIMFNFLEPLLSRNIKEFIGIAKKNGLKTHIITNGYFLEGKYKELADAGLDSIQISLDGPPAVNDKLRGLRNGFEKAMNGIRMLSQYSESIGKRINIRITYTITNHNYGQLVRFLKCLNNTKEIDLVIFQNLYFITKRMADKYNKEYKDYPSHPSSVSGEIKPGGVDIKVLYEQINQIKKNKHKYNFKINFIPEMNYTLENLKEYYQNETSFIHGFEKCGFLYTNNYVTTEGNVMLYPRCYYIVLGNIRDKSFMGIWNSPKYKALRKKFYKKTPPACSRCCGVMVRS